MNLQGFQLNQAGLELPGEKLGCVGPGRGEEGVAEEDREVPEVERPDPLVPINPKSDARTRIPSRFVPGTWWFRVLLGLRVQ